MAKSTCTKCGKDCDSCSNCSTDPTPNTPSDESQRRARELVLGKVALLTSSGDLLGATNHELEVLKSIQDEIAAALDEKDSANQKLLNEIISSNVSIYEKKLADQAKEIERLTAELQLADVPLSQVESFYIDRISSLEQGLRKYGEHRLFSCGTYEKPAECKCGLDALLTTEPTTQREPDGVYGPKHDPEVTCWHCKKTFLCDCMDATCRLCGAPFDKKRCEEFGFKPTEPSGGGK